MEIRVPLDEGTYPHLIHTFQIMRIARPRLHELGGSVSQFLSVYASDADATDGIYDAVHFMPFAPANGRLCRILHRYLIAAPDAKPLGLGVPEEKALSILEEVWFAAPTISGEGE